MIPQCKQHKYWARKLYCFFHDPPFKVFVMKEHKKHSNEIRSEFRLPQPEETEKDCKPCQEADKKASGLDRIILPYLPQKQAKCAGFVIDYSNGNIEKLLRHPLSAACLRVTIGNSNIKECFNRELKDVLKNFRGDLTSYFDCIFHFVRHFFPRVLAQNCQDLSWFWEHLPADSRLPDHSIWQHCAATSAIYSCITCKANVPIIVLFEFYPVQDFIAGARKLRDLWTGSVLLSYLSFAVSVKVIDELGSDHILFPNPVGQPLIEKYLLRKFSQKCSPLKGLAKDVLVTNDEMLSKSNRRVASLPNRLLALVPFDEPEIFSSSLQKAFADAWEEIWKGVQKYVKERIKEKIEEKVPNKDCLGCFDEIFKRQCKDFWTTLCVFFPLISDKNEIKELKLKQNIFIDNALKKKPSWDKDILKDCCLINYRNVPYFYSACYASLLTGLDLFKSTDVIAEEKKEEGIKCSLHPELEALKMACEDCSNKCKVWEEEKRRGVSERAIPYHVFWKYMREIFRGLFTQAEMLSSIGVVKRLMWHWLKEALKSKNGLSDTLCVLAEYVELEKEEGSAVYFDSTYEVALREHFERIEQEEGQEKVNEILEELSRENSRETIDSVLKRRGIEVRAADKYYAVVFMDGDGIGKLLSKGPGKKVWDFLHPSLQERINDDTQLRTKNGTSCKKLLEKLYKNLDRPLSPAVHAHISKIMTDFATKVVPMVVERYKGVLIYAGGDDLCALFPASEAPLAVKEIAELFSENFFSINKTVYVKRVAEGGESGIKRVENIKIEVKREEGSEKRVKEWENVFYGMGKDSTISAGVLVVHCKWPLRDAIKRGRALLKLAKNVGKENGKKGLVAFELQRRGGEPRGFIAEIKSEEYETFCDMKKYVSEVPNSLAYKLKELSEVFSEPNDGKNFLKKFVAMKLGLSPDDEVVKKVETVVGLPSIFQKKEAINPDALVIASFLWRK